MENTSKNPSKGQSTLLKNIRMWQWWFCNIWHVSDRAVKLTEAFANPSKFDNSDPFGRDALIGQMSFKVKCDRNGKLMPITQVDKFGTSATTSNIKNMDFCRKCVWLWINDCPDRSFRQELHYNIRKIWIKIIKRSCGLSDLWRNKTT